MFIFVVSLLPEAKDQEPPKLSFCCLLVTLFCSSNEAWSSDNLFLDMIGLNRVFLS